MKIATIPSLAALMLLALCQAPAAAHFPWIVLPSSGEREFGVVFSENLSPDDPSMLEKLRPNKAVLYSADGKTAEVSLTLRDDQLIGQIPADFDLVAIELPFTWGMFNRGESKFLLRYRAIGIVDVVKAMQIKIGTQGHITPALSLRPADGQALEIAASFDSKPLASESITVIGPADVKGTTDQSGKWLWQPEKNGDYGMFVKATSAEKGEWEGESYEEVRSYTTVALTIEKGGSDNSDSDSQAAFAELPFGITSFGAARLGDAIYVYGGHTGSAHTYSDQEQNNQLLKLDLNQPEKSWEVVAEGKRLQGLAMVAHGSKLITVGGFQATNKEGEEHDLHSQTDVTAYDITTQQWSDLPALPLPRSSHDAVVLGDIIYVVGGWYMDSPKEAKWHTAALAMDLSAEKPEWVELPAPPFQRRALALAAHDGKIYAIGGMNESGGPTRNVAIYDPAAKSWSDGPAILGENGMAGFGASAWSVNGRLVVSNINGDVQVLQPGGTEWKTIGQTDEARFFHRVLPLDDKRLISVGGASMEVGKFLTPESISID